MYLIIDQKLLSFHSVHPCRSRSLNENIDLHYVSMIQLSQMLVATKNFNGALAIFCKILLTLSVTIQRSFYCNAGFANSKLDVELKKQMSAAFNCSGRLTKWVQLHNGPLHDQPAPIFRLPIWWFEESSSKKGQDKEFATVGANASLVPNISRHAESRKPKAEKKEEDGGSDKAGNEDVLKVNTTTGFEHPPDEVDHSHLPSYLPSIHSFTIVKNYGIHIRVL